MLTTRLTDVVTSMIKVMPPHLPSMSDASATEASLFQVHDALQRYAESGGHEIKCTCSSSSSQPCANPECQSRVGGSSSSSSSSSDDPHSAASKKVKRKSAGDASACVCSLLSSSPCSNSDCVIRKATAALSRTDLFAFSASAPSSFSIQINAPVSASAAASVPVEPTVSAPRLNWSAKHGQDLSLHEYFLTLFPKFGLSRDQGGLTYGEIGLKIVERFSLPFKIKKEQVESHCVIHRAFVGVK